MRRQQHISSQVSSSGINHLPAMRFLLECHMRLELMTSAWKAAMLPLHQWHACTDFFNLGFQESVNLGFQMSYSVAFRATYSHLWWHLRKMAVRRRIELRSMAWQAIILTTERPNHVKRGYPISPKFAQNTLWRGIAYSKQLLIIAYANIQLRDFHLTFRYLQIYSVNGETHPKTRERP